MSDLKVGDVVSRKSGGVHMSIREIHGDFAECEYFELNDETEVDEIKSTRLPLVTLRHVPLEFLED